MTLVQKWPPNFNADAGQHSAVSRQFPSDDGMLEVAIESGLWSVFDLIAETFGRAPAVMLGELHRDWLAEWKPKGPFSGFIRCWIVFEIIITLRPDGPGEQFGG